MTAATDFLEAEWMKWGFTNESVSRPTAWFIALHTADPGETGSNAECAYSGYQRVQLSGSPPWTRTGGQVSNTESLVFAAQGSESPVTIAHLSVWTSQSGGNCLYKGALDLGKTFNQNDVPNFGVGEIILEVN